MRVPHSCRSQHLCVQQFQATFFKLNPARSASSTLFRFILLQLGLPHPPLVLISFSISISNTCSYKTNSCKVTTRVIARWNMRAYSTELVQQTAFSCNNYNNKRQFSIWKINFILFVLLTVVPGAHCVGCSLSGGCDAGAKNPTTKNGVEPVLHKIITIIILLHIIT